MACALTVSSVTGTVSGGNLASLTVSGTVTDCPSINVSVACGSGGSLVATVNVSPPASTWSVTWSGNDLVGFSCPCAKTVVVNVECVTDPSCGATASMPIDCNLTGPNSYDCTMTYKSWFCPTLFFVLTVTLAAAIAFYSLAACQGLSVVAGPLGSWANWLLLASILALAVYYVLCNQCQCGWVWRLLWRVLFAVGLVITTFTGCCSSLLTPGWIMTAAGIVAMILWLLACPKTTCDVVNELVLVLGTMVIPPITFVLSLGAPQACVLVLFTIGSFVFTLANLILLVFYALVVYQQSSC